MLCGRLRATSSDRTTSIDDLARELPHARKLPFTHSSRPLNPKYRGQIKAVHPSPPSNFNLPMPLQPRKQMPVNALCWCGSGKKWKKCHRDREHQKPVPIGKLRADYRQALMSGGYCLHPQANAATCSPNIIRAHSVQRKGGLAAIAEDGHVISPKRGFEDIAKNDGEIVPRQQGVNDASTFVGFCGAHDEQLFSPIEKSSITLDKQAAFLLSFRAICYEIYSKVAVLRTIEIQRQADKGKSFEMQCSNQQYLHAFREGLKLGIRDLNFWKGKYDAAFLNGHYDEFLFYGVRLSNALPLVSCGAFHPEFDFKGNNLQNITRGEDVFEHLCFNLTVVGGKSVAVLGWTGSPQGPAKQFIDSFKTLPKDTVANAAFHIACEHLENTYFRPSWWESQTTSAKEHLVRRFRSGTGFRDTERRSDCFSRLEYSFATATIELELSS